MPSVLNKAPLLQLVGRQVPPNTVPLLEIAQLPTVPLCWGVILCQDSWTLALCRTFKLGFQTKTWGTLCGFLSLLSYLIPGTLCSTSLSSFGLSEFSVPSAQEDHDNSALVSPFLLQDLVNGHGQKSWITERFCFISLRQYILGLTAFQCLKTAVLYIWSDFPVA